MKSVAVAILAACCCLAGCGVRAETSPRALDTDAAMYQVLNRHTSQPPQGGVRTLLYFVTDGSLVAVSRSIAGPLSPHTMVQALLAGPTAGETASGLTTSVSDVISVPKPPSSEGVLAVELPAASSADAGRSDEVLEYAQIVATLSTLKNVSAIMFTRAGVSLTVPRADGSLSTGPVTRADYAALL